MRWDSLSIGDGDTSQQSLPLGPANAVVRTIDTPAFAGMTFYEINAKSLISRVPAGTPLPFQWTINPYRGCSHACTYCFARNTHTYLDLDAGHDFDSRIVVKVNAEQLLRRELGSARWRGEPIAMGTNVDCYQRAEGRYRLMRGIIAALRDWANPFSILTKGTLIARDLDLLKQAAAVTSVGISFSVGTVDERVWRTAEPGTPSPRRRLDAVRLFSDAGFRVSVLMAPILPGISDTDAALASTVEAIAAAGATSVVPLTLHLRPGAREWYLAWLARTHPEHVERYRELYRGGSYAPKAYQRGLGARVHTLARRYGLNQAHPTEHRQAGTATVASTSPVAEQLTLL